MKVKEESDFDSLIVQLNALPAGNINATIHFLTWSPGCPPVAQFPLGPLPSGPTELSPNLAAFPGAGLKESDASGTTTCAWLSPLLISVSCENSFQEFFLPVFRLVRPVRGACELLWRVSDSIPTLWCIYPSRPSRTARKTADDSRDEIVACDYGARQAAEDWSALRGRRAYIPAAGPDPKALGLLLGVGQRRKGISSGDSIYNAPTKDRKQKPTSGQTGKANRCERFS